MNQLICFFSVLLSTFFPSAGPIRYVRWTQVLEFLCQEKMLQKSEFRRKVFFLLAAENRSSGLSSRGVSLRGLEMVLREVRLISGSFFISYFLLILLNLLGMQKWLFLQMGFLWFFCSGMDLLPSLRFSSKSRMFTLLAFGKFSSRIDGRYGMSDSVQILRIRCLGRIRLLKF